MRIHYTFEDEEYLRHNYANIGAYLCSLHLNKTQKQIRIKAQRMGLKLSFSTRSNIIKKHKSLIVKKDTDYSVNPQQFYNVTSPETAYLLGFLWADGYVYRTNRQDVIGVSIKRDDFDSYIKTILEKHGRWNIHYWKQDGRKEQGRARISNKPLCIFLEDMGYRSKNNSAIKIITHIPKHLQHYWFRGLFDGDGCVYYGNGCSISVSGPYDQDWSYMEELFKYLNVKYYLNRIKNKYGKRSEIGIKSKRDMLIFLNHIYNNFENDKIGFQRKYDKFMLVKNSYRQKSSKYIGVSKTQSNTWQCKLCQHGCNLFLGTFKTETDAALAYNTKATELFGNDAVLNVI